MTPNLSALSYLHAWEAGPLPPGGIAYEPLLRRIRLDYSPDSLARIDVFLDALRTAKKPQRDPFLEGPEGQNLLYLLAFYVGEVLSRALRWPPRWLTWAQAEAEAPSPRSDVYEQSVMVDFLGSAARVGHFAPLVSICSRLFDAEVTKSVLFSASSLLPDGRTLSGAEPLPPAPAFVHRVDVRDMLARCMPAERARLEIVAPPWADRDPLGRWFRGAERLLETGRVVWAGLIQANNALFTPADDGGAPGEVVYDPTGRASAEVLDEAAQLLFSLKGKRLQDPSLAAFSDYLTDEMTRVFGTDVPAVICPYPLKVATTVFYRPYLPGAVIAQRCFPVLVSDELPGIVLFLPAATWPAVLLKAWKR